jgi:Zn-dependent protease with chaperone function
MIMPQREIPYPPSPEDVPEKLTHATPNFIFQATLMVLTLLLFMLIYLGMMAFCGYLVYWGFSTFSHFWPVKIPLIILGIVLLLFLLKGFFIRDTHDRKGLIELEEDEFPDLYEFIERLCGEITAPFPHRIFVQPEVNAAMMYRMSLINLIVPAKNDLLLGLGLVNCLNLSEFKAVVAHELGHFAQKGFINSYSYIATNVIATMLTGNDWLDNILQTYRREDHLGGYLAAALYWTIHVIKTGLYGIFMVINFLHFKIRRQREFNADLVGVSVAGSNAIVHGLKRTALAEMTLVQACRELEDAADHRLYTSDMFFHQTRAAAYIKKINKDPRFGDPPELKGPRDGKDVQVFDPDEDGEVHMWDYHPSMFDREENAKTVFIPAVMDERPAWILFNNALDLRERVTYKFYRIVHKVSKDVALAETETVQKFIDDEHAEMTFDPKYHGVYDGRLIEPGKLEELDEMIQSQPWENARLANVEAKLYQGLERRVEEYQDVRKEFNTLMRQCNYRPRGRTKRLVDKLDDELQEHLDWLASFDRRVYLVYMQMAKRLETDELYADLKSRYKFHLPLQNLNRDASDSYEKMDYFANLLFTEAPNQIPQDLIAEAMHVFRQARKSLKEILRHAREMDIPMLKHFTGTEALDEFLLNETLIKELPEDFVQVRWLQKLDRQLGQVLKKSARLYFKSMGNILALQEQIAQKFNAQLPSAAETPVEAREEILDAILEDEVEQVESRRDDDDDRRRRGRSRKSSSGVGERDSGRRSRDADDRDSRRRSRDADDRDSRRRSRDDQSDRRRNRWDDD